MGGFCLAFRKEGFEVTWANEKDRFAVETYRHNFQSTTMHHKPVEELSVIGDDLEPVDVLTAGFPCQPFSKAGIKLGFEDERGGAFFQVMRLLREFGDERPKILLFENVQYLQTHHEKQTFGKMVHAIKAAGYWFREGTSRVLNTKTHTEIPQNRERLYMAAVRSDCFKKNGFVFPEPDPAVVAYRTLLDLHEQADRSFYYEESSQYREMFQASMDAGG